MLLLEIIVPGGAQFKFDYHERRAVWVDPSRTSRLLESCGTPGHLFRTHSGAYSDTKQNELMRYCQKEKKIGCLLRNRARLILL